MKTKPDPIGRDIEGNPFMIPDDQHDFIGFSHCFGCARKAYDELSNAYRSLLGEVARAKCEPTPKDGAMPLPAPPEEK
jgi:hypothetical protein